MSYGCSKVILEAEGLRTILLMTTHAGLSVQSPPEDLIV